MVCVFSKISGTSSEKTHHEVTLRVVDEHHFEASLLMCCWMLTVAQDIGVKYQLGQCYLSSPYWAPYEVTMVPDTSDRSSPQSSNQGKQLYGLL